MMIMGALMIDSIGEPLLISIREKILKEWLAQDDELLFIIILIINECFERGLKREIETGTTFHSPTS